MQKTVYLIDASIYIFRAWFSLPDTLRGDEGQLVNAVYGFSRFLTEFVEKSQAAHVAIAFDESLTASFRNQLYPQYKMNRELPPAELAQQFQWCRKIAEAAGIYCVASDQYEADDLIATIAQQMRQHDFKIVIVSADKDLAQIVRGQDIWWDFAKNKTYNKTQIREKFGVQPEQIQDYLGLCGDAVDNIPGVPGIGPKAAAVLLNQFENVQAIYQDIDKVAQLNVRGAQSLKAKLIQYQQQALLSKQLATVAYNAPISLDPQDVKRHEAEIMPLKQLSQRLGGRAEGLFQRLIDSSRRIQTE